MTTQEEDLVAVFIDYENVALSFRNKYDDEIQWPLIMETALDWGRITFRRSYADWSIFKSGQREMLGMGIDLVHVPAKRGKNAADIRIVIDAMEMLLSGNNTTTHVLLISGDGDFTELVHKMRGQGKNVIGMGISGATAEYLINACDQFIFYDKLVGADIPSDEEDEVIEATVAFDISEARQLLRRALQRHEGEWTSAGKIKSAMRGMNPAFSERNYKFSNFKAFLSAQDDLVQMQTAEGGHLEVQMIQNNGNNNSPKSSKANSPQAKLDKYLHILSKQKIRMTPNENRPQIILRLFNLMQNNPEKSLNELKDELHAYFEETAPHVKYQYVHETVHQLFHTYCFTFDKEGDYPSDVRLWDRKVQLANGIKRPPDLLDKCDRGLLQRISRRVGGLHKIDREVAARLLYGSVRGQKMLDHIDELIKELSSEKNSS